MSDYIERDLDRDYFCTTSGTIPINPSDSSTSSGNQEYDENLERWNWLIKGWSSMTFKEKMAIFTPYLHYINPRNNFKVEFDEVFNTEIVEFGYKLCRTFAELKFDPDRQGIPNMVVVYNPIDITCIPDASIKDSVVEWGKKYGFIHSNCGCR